MNRPEHSSRLIPIPDVQSEHDDRHLAIDQVGIRGLKHPLLFADGGARPQPTVAQCSLYVALPAEQKGTHMSRLVALVEERAAASTPLTVVNFRTLVDEMVARLGAPAGSIELQFPFFVRKTAPVSGVASLLDYDVTLKGELADGRYTETLRVAVPVMSLCPCSKEISDYGAHNQRSLITLTVRTHAPIALAELLRFAEEEASAELYGLLKRADEKYITEYAYDHPRFVEDLVRGVAGRLAAEPRVAAFAVEAENFESIHNHSAYARIARGL
ncbi:MAG: GTP cyclohydrolase I FolE2 [Proteobacteria bacterium]|nr:GTP cyclohydrolase I FolE2 [Pseudomonadota bacterium]